MEVEVKHKKLWDNGAEIVNYLNELEKEERKEMLKAVIREIIAWSKVSDKAKVDMLTDILGEAKSGEWVKKIKGNDPFYIG